MRRLGFLFPALAILLTACNEGIITETPVDTSKAASLTFALEADMRNDFVEVKSESDVISVDDFWVEIFNSTNMRIFCEKYVDAKDTTIYVNSGDYRLLATYGVETGVGFDKPYYKADLPFTVGPQETVALSATAYLANVKVAVNFDEELGNKLAYDQYWAVVRNNGKKLRFNPEETRAGYIPAGELEFVLVVKINGEFKQYVHPAQAYSPNDFVTFNVSVPRLNGDIVLGVMIDNSVEVIELEDVVIPNEKILPVSEPTIYSEGFDNDNSVTFVEGKAEMLDELWLSATAGGTLSSAVLSFEGDVLGLPQSVDLVTADAATVAALDAKGIWWKFNDDKTSVSISILDLYNHHISKLGYVGYDADAQKCLPTAKVGLKIEAATGAVKSEEDTFLFIAEPNAATGTISVNNYDVWATKVVNPTLKLGAGNYNKTKVQYSLDGQSWTDLQDVTSATYSMGTITGLTPATTYYLRAVYDGWLQVAAPMNFTTEAAQQVGNAGFEEFEKKTFNYTMETVKLNTWPYTTLAKGGNTSREWYLPTCGWWAVSSRKTMPDSTTPSDQDFKCFPNVSYYLDGTNKSAQLVSTYVSNMATANTDGDSSIWDYLGGAVTVTTRITRSVGEIWIGTADDGGYHATDSHSFGSRPVAMKFDYTYAPKGNESFYAKIQILDAKKNVIASKEITEAASKSSWTEYTMNLDYTDTTKKAAYIYVQFKSSSCADTDITHSRNQTVQMAGTNYKGHVGSILKIDNIELVY